MKREVIYLKVKVVIEYDTKMDRRQAIAAAKVGVTEVSEFGGGYGFRPIKAVELKEVKP